MRLKKKDSKDSERSGEVYADGGGIWGKVFLSWGDGGIKKKKTDMSPDEMLFDF